MEFITIAAKEFEVLPKYRVLSKPMIRIAGLVNPMVGETYEMLYQYDSPYLFDSTKFAKHSLSTPPLSVRSPDDGGFV